jgi:hypothetical protein
MTTLYQNAHSPERVAINTRKYLDLAVVAFAAIVALALGAPVFGIVVGLCAWLLQRVVQVLDRSFISRLRDPRHQVGIRVSESFGRIWLLAGAIIFAGLAGNHKDGLFAALMIFVAYSVAFGVRLSSGPPPERKLN